MTWYLWIKALHIIGVVCWFAGLFYLPRLFVYHDPTRIFRERRLGELTLRDKGQARHIAVHDGRDAGALQV